MDPAISFMETKKKQRGFFHCRSLLVMVYTNVQSWQLSLQRTMRLIILFVVVLWCAYAQQKAADSLHLRKHVEAIR